MGDCYAKRKNYFQTQPNLLNNDRLVANTFAIEYFGHGWYYFLVIYDTLASLDCTRDIIPYKYIIQSYGKSRYFGVYIFLKGPVSDVYQRLVMLRLKLGVSQARSVYWPSMV